MTSSTASSRRTGKGERGRRARLSATQREAADVARVARIAALHEQTGEHDALHRWPVIDRAADPLLAVVECCLSATSAVHISSETIRFQAIHCQRIRQGVRPCVFVPVGL
jgi:hypothetical protein